MRPDHPTPMEMFDEASGLMAGLVTILMPLFIIAVPGVLLLLIAPLALVAVAGAIPAVIAAVLLGPPYLLFRAIRRRSQRSLVSGPPAPPAGVRPRAVGPPVRS
jgi:hypothetical protein